MPEHLYEILPGLRADDYLIIDSSAHFTENPLKAPNGRIDLVTDRCYT